MLKQHGSTSRTCLRERAMLGFCSSKEIYPAYGRNLGNGASRARDVFSELKALGESVKDDELAFNVLNGLRAEFETIRTILLASDQSLRLEAILPKLQQEENMK
jgi:hypothetical protein